MKQNKKPSSNSLIYRNIVNYGYGQPAAEPEAKPASSKKFFVSLALVLLLIVLGYVGWRVIRPAANSSSPQITAAAKSSDRCSGNALAHEIIVSLSQQHMWACGGSRQAYDSSVVTGMAMYVADATPTGTYHIYVKQTNQSLSGCDTTGCWDDHVYYWLPFFTNKYGVYGFHDATWRSPSEFGRVNINAPYTATEHGSHGCVEMPTTAAKWLYNWAPVGTTVKIES